MPNALKLDGDESQRLVLSILSKFVSDFKIDYDGEEKTILEAIMKFIVYTEQKYKIMIWNMTEDIYLQL